MISGITKLDLHMHTSVSDGTDMPEAVPALVKATGLDLFAVTDHDSISACARIRKARTPEDPLFLPGVEFSCKDENGKYHILGYGFDPDAEPIRRVLEKGHAFRLNKVKKRLEFLETAFGFSFSPEDLRTLYAIECPGKPHIGNLMVKYGYATTKEDAIEHYIDQIRFKSEYIRPEEAIEGILGGGGIPVLAHPVYGDGGDMILGSELEERVDRLTSYGLQGLEAYYSGFTPKMCQEVLRLAGKQDLYVTAGSDYHGANKMVMLGDTGLPSAQDDESLQRFLADVRIG
ncbi:MAG: PHP domain-containing protein [Clostridia bacterium]|nr:PHP domain-containing protein [Clostridia bacterium]